MSSAVCWEIALTQNKRKNIARQDDLIPTKRTNPYTNLQPSWRHLTEMAPGCGETMVKQQHLHGRARGVYVRRSNYACVDVRAKWYQEQAFACIEDVHIHKMTCSYIQ